MSRVLLFFALVAMAFTGASAGTLYSTIDDSGTVDLDTACGTTLKTGASSILVKWSGFSDVSASEMDIKLCFTDDKIKERPWRKFNDIIKKNKQCWQTAELKKFLKSGVSYRAEGQENIDIPMNTAPSTYTVQVLSKDAAGEYLQYGDSKTDECIITTEIYNNMPSTLIGTQAFFAVFSIVVLIAAYTYDSAKQA